MNTEQERELLETYEGSVVLSVAKIVERLRDAEEMLGLCATDTTAVDLRQDIAFFEAEREDLLERLTSVIDLAPVLTPDAFVKHVAAIRDNLARLIAATDASGVLQEDPPSPSVEAHLEPRKEQRDV